MRRESCSGPEGAVKTSLDVRNINLGPQRLTPDTEVVKVGLELGDVIGRGQDGRNAEGGVLLPEIA